MATHQARSTATSPTPATPTPTDAAERAENVEWRRRSAGMTVSYLADIRCVCDGAGLHRITERNGVVTDVETLSSGVLGDLRAPERWTITAVLEIAETATGVVIRFSPDGSEMILTADPIANAIDDEVTYIATEITLR